MGGVFAEAEGLEFWTGFSFSCVFEFELVDFDVVLFCCGCSVDLAESGA